MLKHFSTNTWEEALSEDSQLEAISHLENGGILYFPELAFKLSEKEKVFLRPDYADPHAKNISYHKDQRKLWGVQHLTDDQHIQLKAMLDRFAHAALHFTKTLFPHYQHDLRIARTSFRPVQISGRKTSKRKDDKRLHIDAFPSAPNQGNRILRVFCNINPHGENRIWRIGEPFEQVARRFIPEIKQPRPGSAALLRLLRITKSYRSPYDHYMLQIHDRMKLSDTYQKEASQQQVEFSPGSTWIVQTDQVSHAAMKGQYVLEQTFYLPVQAMKEPTHSPLRILEKMIGEPLV